MSDDSKRKKDEARRRAATTTTSTPASDNGLGPFGVFNTVIYSGSAGGDGGVSCGDGGASASVDCGGF